MNVHSYIVGCVCQEFVYEYFVEINQCLLTGTIMVTDTISKVSSMI